MYVPGFATGELIRCTSSYAVRRFAIAAAPCPDLAAVLTPC